MAFASRLIFTQSQAHRTVCRWIFYMQLSLLISPRIQSFWQRGSDQLPSRDYGICQCSTYAQLHSYLRGVLLPARVEGRRCYVWCDERANTGFHRRGTASSIVSCNSFFQSKFVNPGWIAIMNPTRRSAGSVD
jgi:hypothetical protein